MSQRGFGLLEIVIASSIISATVFSLSYVFILSRRLDVLASDKIRANFLAEEGLEVARLLRDKSWSSNLAGLNAFSVYYLSFNPAGSTWSIGASNPGKIDGLFERRITVEDVYRNFSDDIVSSGGTLDPDTKKINTAVSWSERGATSTVTVSTYLADIFDN